ncbi:alpha/beta hydrolase [Methylobacterium sp. NEAU 140]|uniref:alpha/beta fold hydrolase n=1 Tax=Methylobacterium sp. NEAU 140 TaxID=3064945 RepID=UPI0027354808|nr:alpha/beta hydrolase [Methylobacterium sp. NEAU 140]MDP4023865.1 alpha/beta hydrolase [Methylobacterium sp. NEAU 140]
MKRVRAGVLDVAYAEIGPPDGPPAVLLHGFPYAAHACAAAGEILAGAGVRCLIPSLRGYGATRFRDAATPRSGEQAALGADLLAFLDALGIERAVLAGYDWGGRAACVVAALWPERAAGLVTCGSGYNIHDVARSGRPAAPEAECRLWYQYYFQSERGRAGLTADRAGIARLLWRQWSPNWAFDAQTFAASAAAFDNPDFVDVVIHSYRVRYGLVPGDPAYAQIEARLAPQPRIGVPTVVLEGGDGGVFPPQSERGDAERFTGPYAYRRLPGIGHNVPQEAPEAFAEAVRSLV